MSNPLLDVWEAAASQPFHPTIGKDTQFTVGFALLAACMLRSGPFWCSHSRALLTVCVALVLTTIFGLSMSNTSALVFTPQSLTRILTDRSLVNLPILGVPASLAFGYVASSIDTPLPY